MHGKVAAELNTPDEALVVRTRDGDRAAFAELWRRHYAAGIACARSFTSLDAEDLVSEAFTRIYVRTKGGGGPRGAFRPYLYTTVRNLAATWGTRSARAITTDSFDDVEPTESAEEPVARSLDRSLTVKAYRSLPARWQTVLWYTEVEGLDPHEVGPILGMSANGVAALAYRAREGLRKAWLQAHVKDATATGECAWVIERLGDHSRRGLTDAQNSRLETHLSDCAQCAIVSEEVDEVGSHLAMVLLPLLLGGVAGGTLLTLSGAGSGGAMAATTLGGSTVTAGAATSITVPALPTAIGGATAGSSLLASAASVVAVAASAVFVTSVGVGAVTGAGALTDPAPSMIGQVVSAPAVHDGGSTSTPSTSSNEQQPSGSVDVPSSDTSSTGGATPRDAPSAGSDGPPGTDTRPSSTDGAPASTGTTPVTTTPAGESVADGTSGAVTKTVDGATEAVDKTVKGTTKVVKETVDGTTDAVDKTVKGSTGVVGGVVDTVLPPDKPITGAVNGTVDGLTGTVNGVTSGLTGTVDGTVSGLTSTLDTVTDGATSGVSDLVGGLLKKK